MKIASDFMPHSINESLNVCLLLQMSVPFIPIQEIAIGRCLGEGSEGIVYAGSYLETPVAIKQLSHVQEMEMNLHIGETSI